MKNKKSRVTFDIETNMYYDSTDNQISLLYSLAKKLKKKMLNKQRKNKLDKLNNLNNEY